MIEKKFLQYYVSGCQRKAVLMSMAEHIALHKNALQYKGAIVHNNYATLHSGEAYDVDVCIRRYAWKRRVEVWNEPVKVSFT